MIPGRIGGKPDKGPGLSVTVVSAKPRKPMTSIGGDPDRESEPMDDEPITGEQALDDASDEIIAAITSIKPNPKRLKEALRAFVSACNSDSYEGGEESSEEEGM